VRGLGKCAVFGQAEVDVEARIDLSDAVIVNRSEIGGFGAA
jgi:hypothetical protein